MSAWWPSLHDGVDAWDMAPDGTYTRCIGLGGKIQAHGAQAALMARYA
jgi:hypothetical protein